MRKAVLIVLVLIIGYCCLYRPQIFLHEDGIFEEYLLLVFSDDFGYTLVGAKPASLDDSWTCPLKKISLREVERAEAFMSKAFAQSDRFIFRKINGSLWLINKREMIKKILKYRKLRLFVYKKFGGEEEFFYQLQHGTSNLFDLLDFKCELISIAMGYGLDNGMFYFRRVILGEYLQKYPIVQSYPFDGFPFFDKVRGMNWLFCKRLETVIEPHCLPGFQSLDNEWEWIKQNEWVFRMNSRPDPPYYLCLPAYVSCKSKEAENVHKNFLKARDKLANLFYNRKFSEVIAEEAAKK